MLRCWLYIHDKEKETDRSIENDTACWEAAGGSGLIVYMVGKVANDHRRSS
jgi:hypothetical protein